MVWCGHRSGSAQRASARPGWFHELARQKLRGHLSDIRYSIEVGGSRRDLAYLFLQAIGGAGQHDAVGWSTGQDLCQPQQFDIERDVDEVADVPIMARHSTNRSHNARSGLIQTLTCQRRSCLIGPTVDVRMLV